MFTGTNSHRPDLMSGPLVASSLKCLLKLDEQLLLPDQELRDCLLGCSLQARPLLEPREAIRDRKLLKRTLAEDREQLLHAILGAEVLGLEVLHHALRDSQQLLPDLRGCQLLLCILEAVFEPLARSGEGLKGCWVSIPAWISSWGMAPLLSTSRHRQLLKEDRLQQLRLPCNRSYPKDKQSPSRTKARKGAPVFGCAARAPATAVQGNMDKKRHEVPILTRVKKRSEATPAMSFLTCMLSPRVLTYRATLTYAPNGKSLKLMTKSLYLLAWRPSLLCYSRAVPRSTRWHPCLCTTLRPPGEARYWSHEPGGSWGEEWLVLQKDRSKDLRVDIFGAPDGQMEACEVWYFCQMDDPLSGTPESWVCFGTSQPFE